MTTPYRRTLSRFTLLALALMLSACATQVVEKPTETMPAKQPLKTYSKIVLDKAEMRAPYAGQGANEKAARKINELLEQRLATVFGEVAVVTGDDTPAGDGVLRITPKIKQIKFIGGGARFVAGAMAGSSVVVIDLEFLDLGTQEVVAKTGTYRKGNAYAGGWSVGATDNIMLSDAVDDLVDFARANY